MSEEHVPNPPSARGRRAAAIAPTGTAASRAYHHGDLRDALVASGIRTLQASGSGAVTLRQAARDVGVSQTAPLHHFDSKQSYLAAIAAEGFRMLLERRVEVLRRKRDPRQRLLAVMLAHLRFAVDHAAMFHVMFGSAIPNKAAYPPLHEAASRSFGVLEACVGDYLTHCEIPMAGLRSATLATWAACHGLASVLAERQDAWGVAGGDPEKIGRDVFGIFIAGLDHLVTRRRDAAVG